MTRYSTTGFNKIRKRTIAAFFVLGLILLLAPVAFFYYHLRQERQLTVDEPPAETSSATDSDHNNLPVPQDFFEAAEEKSVEVRGMHDKQRQENIDAIHQALQAHYAEEGAYPTLTRMNSDGYRQGAFPNLTNEDFIDPDNVDAAVTITRTPQATVYAYDVVNEDGYTCEPSGRKCVDYTLTALLSNNSLYSVTTNEEL